MMLPRRSASEAVFGVVATEPLASVVPDGRAADSPDLALE
jgi:hypothetical protein